MRRFTATVQAVEIDHADPESGRSLPSSFADGVPPLRMRRSGIAKFLTGAQLDDAPEFGRDLENRN
jgi:hypothetical protein